MVVSCYYTCLLLFALGLVTADFPPRNRLRTTSRALEDVENPENDHCEDAIFLAPTAHYPHPSTPLVIGTTIGAVDSNRPYDNVDGNYRVFYQFVTRNNARYLITTCHDETDFDTTFDVSNSVSTRVEYRYLRTLAASAAGNFGLSIMEYILPDNARVRSGSSHDKICLQWWWAVPRMRLVRIIPGTGRRRTTTFVSDL